MTTTTQTAIPILSRRLDEVDLWVLLYGATSVPTATLMNETFNRHTPREAGKILGRLFREGLLVYNTDREEDRRTKRAVRQGQTEYFTSDEGLAVLAAMMGLPTAARHLIPNTGDHKRTRLIAELLLDTAKTGAVLTWDWKWGGEPTVERSLRALVVEGR